MQRVGIGQIRIAPEQAVDHRGNKAPLQQVCRLRFFQRQRGKKGQIDCAVGGGARVERVDDVVGLAEPERQPDDEVGPDVADDILRDRLGVGEHFRHRMKARGAIGSQRLESGAAASSYSVIAADIRL